MNAVKSTSEGAEMCRKVDAVQHLQIELKEDGTISRLREDPRRPAAGDPNPPIPVLSQDATINESNGTFARIFLPRKALHGATTKLPLIVYFHGGGFVLFSAASDFFHEACASLAKDANCVVVSVEYRLAPEHRLPAAYEDAVEALHWLQLNSHSHLWLKNHADYSNCYLMGSSAGANIAYHAALHLDKQLQIRGLILSQPFFGATTRLPSEVRLADDRVLPPHVCDLLWELSLPVGVDRDHEYCNPRGVSVRVSELTWRLLVSGCHGDPLVDHQIAFATLMAEKGVQVVTSFIDGGCHGAEVRSPIHRNHFYELVKHFIASCG